VNKPAKGTGKKKKGVKPSNQSEKRCPLTTKGEALTADV